MFRLHGMSSSGNCYKPHLLMAQLGVPFEWVEVDVIGGETRGAQFRAMNPSGKVPVLEIAPGQYLPESNAILCFLAEGTPLLPADRLARARVLQWLFFEQYSHEPNIAVARFWVRFRGAPPELAEQLARKQHDGHAALAVMERRLARHPFLVDDRYTVADIALYAYSHVAGEGGIELAPYPGVNAWLDRVRAQPGYVPMKEPAARG